MRPTTQSWSRVPTIDSLRVQERREAEHRSMGSCAYKPVPLRLRTRFTVDLLSPAGVVGADLGDPRLALTTSSGLANERAHARGARRDVDAGALQLRPRFCQIDPLF